MTTNIALNNDPFMKAFAEYEQNNSFAAVGNTIKEVGKYVGDKLPGACKYSVDQVRSLVDAIGPKKSLFTGLAYLTYGPLLAALALGASMEGPNLAREAKSAVMGYIDIGAKSKEYESLEGIISKEKSSLGMMDRNLSGVGKKKGLYSKIMDAKKYERVVAGAGRAGVDVEDYVCGKVKSRKVSELEGEIMRYRPVELSLEDLESRYGEYRDLGGEPLKGVEKILSRKGERLRKWRRRRRKQK